MARTGLVPIRSTEDEETSEGETFAAAAYHTLSNDPSKLDRLVRTVRAHQLGEQLSQLNLSASWVVADPGGGDGPPQIIHIDPTAVSGSSSGVARMGGGNGESGVRGRLRGTYPRKAIATTTSATPTKKEQGEEMSSGVGSPREMTAGGASATIALIEDDDILGTGAKAAPRKTKKKNNSKKKKKGSKKSVSESPGTSNDSESGNGNGSAIVSASGSVTSGTIIGVMEEDEEDVGGSLPDRDEDGHEESVEIELGRAPFHGTENENYHTLSRQQIDDAVPVIQSAPPQIPFQPAVRDFSRHQTLPPLPDSSAVRSYVPVPTGPLSIPHTLSIPRDSAFEATGSRHTIQEGPFIHTHTRNSSASTVESTVEADQPPFMLSPLTNMTPQWHNSAVSDIPSARQTAPIVVRDPTPPQSPELDQTIIEPQATSVSIDLECPKRPLTPLIVMQIPSITFADPTTPLADVHPLSKGWTMYFSDTSSGGSSRHQRILSPLNPLAGQTHLPPSAMDYSSNLVTVFSADTLEDLFGGWKAFRRKIALSKGRVIEPLGDSSVRGGMGLGTHLYPEDSNFHLFVQGVSPMWEDVMCQKGGKIMIAGDAPTMDHIFFEVALLLISSEIDTALPYPSAENVGIVGAVLSRRKLTRIEIWIGGEVAPDIEWTKQLTGLLIGKFGGPMSKVYGYKAFGKSH
ncbi:hypothetical protein I317_00642 [Kwoniella heveanensis CBS 569]|uniref:Translation initiation factor 4E n=1 Tax=Kwoniella heveanensis BCC8398 TaxID=1296120 RepID=A0A1B9H034_9TREE|nr:hypothetical protein I316_01871 [Kwoniella heveanensis BCC8398]OCF45397.1 hypothetical protein I317_00642 [Kwoniella heveanensis CBS 569]